MVALPAWDASFSCEGSRMKIEKNLLLVGNMRTQLSGDTNPPPKNRRVQLRANICFITISVCLFLWENLSLFLSLLPTHLSSNEIYRES